MRTLLSTAALPDAVERGRAVATYAELGQLHELAKKKKVPPPAITVSAVSSPSASGSVTITGQTYDKAKVSLFIGGGKKAALTVKASKKGLFQLTYAFGYGSTAVRLTTTAAGHKAASLTLTVNRAKPGPPAPPAPPAIVVQGISAGSLTRTEVTYTGTVTDAGPGVASFGAVVDGGALVPVALGSNGTFSFTTTLPLNGTADGGHQVQFLAVDRAGNVGKSTVESFTLDTTPPAITITSPASGLTTATNITVTGHVADALSGIASFGAQVDGGAVVAVAVDSAGDFSYTTALSLTGSADGPHQIQFVAADGAGNVGRSATESFTLSAMAPIVTIISPEQGLTTASNVTVFGQVTDAHSGIASLTAQLDGGTAVAVPVDSPGVFYYTTALAVDGSADGPHTILFVATSDSGTVSAPVSYGFTLQTITTLGTPGLAAASQTGSSANITSDTTPTVVVNATSGETVSLLINGTVVRQAVSNDGQASFTLGPLADGSYTLTAADEISPGDFVGTSSPFTLQILTAPPATPTFDLAAGTADVAPETTSATLVTLVGETSPGVMLSLVGTGLTALASDTGGFQIPSVDLAVGANTLTVEAIDGAGNSSSNSLTVTRSATAPSEPDPVIVWNEATLSAIQTDGTDPDMASRALAMVQAAVYDTVNNIEGLPAYYVKMTAPADSNIDAAVDAAAHDVLDSLYPAQQSTFDSLFASDLALLPAGQGTTDGEAVGQAVGNAIITMRANDGSKAFVDFTPGTAPGDWQETAPAFAPASIRSGAT